jgi:hypothetical protein
VLPLLVLMSPLLMLMPPLPLLLLPPLPLPLSAAVRDGGLRPELPGPEALRR